MPPTPLSPVHPAYRMDPATLREVLDDPTGARTWCEHPHEPTTVAYWRMLGDFDRAREAGEWHLARQAEGSPQRVSAAVRLAHVHHWQGAYAQAHLLLESGRCRARSSAIPT